MAYMIAEQPATRPHVNRYAPAGVWHAQKTARDAFDGTGPAASDKQVGLLRRLIAEREVDGGLSAADALAVFEGLVADGSYTKAQASVAISTLLAAPKRPVAPVATPAPADASVVLDGSYAIDYDGTVGFFKVRTHATGKWAGFTFVDRQASDDLYPIKDRAKKAAILAAIALDQQAAMARYGHEIGACGACGRTLTDEASRERGIGPVCADKRGW